MVGFVDGLTEQELQTTSSSSDFLHMEEEVVLHKAHFGFKPKGILLSKNLCLFTNTIFRRHKRPVSTS